jgi:hypothetical protein
MIGAVRYAPDDGPLTPKEKNQETWVTASWPRRRLIGAVPWIVPHGKIQTSHVSPSCVFCMSGNFTYFVGPGGNLGCGVSGLHSFQESGTGSLDDTDDVSRSYFRALSRETKDWCLSCQEPGDAVRWPQAALLQQPHINISPREIRDPNVCREHEHDVNALATKRFLPHRTSIIDVISTTLSALQTNHPA